MLRRTPLKSKTPLKAKTPLRSYSMLKAKTPLKSKTRLKQTVIGPVVEGVKVKVSKTKRKPDYVKDMDRVFQYYIRLRDAMPGGYTRCISCSKVKPFDQMQGGHFFGRACFALRWNEDNVHSECIYDNCYNGEHLLGYRENLIKKIGIQRFRTLDVLRHSIKKWSTIEIQAMILHYGRLCLQLSSSKRIPISKSVLDIINRYERNSRIKNM